MVGQTSTMRAESLWPWALLLAVAFAVTWHLVWRYRARVAERRDRPAGLRDAELFCVESQFRSKSRWPIVARSVGGSNLPSPDGRSIGEATRALRPLVELAKRRERLV